MATIHAQSGPGHAVSAAALDDQVLELERLGFAIVSRSDDEVVAMRRKWYWECFPPHVTSVVFLMATGPLSAAEVAGETDQLLARARELDAGGLAFVRMRAVLQAYVAEDVLPDAQRLCTTAQPVGMSSLAFTAALARSTGDAYFVRDTPLIGGGGMFVPKLRFLAARLFEPDTAPTREPLSGMGLVFVAIWAVVVVIVVVEIVAAL